MAGKKKTCTKCGRQYVKWCPSCHRKERNERKRTAWQRGEERMERIRKKRMGW